MHNETQKHCTSRRAELQTDYGVSALLLRSCGLDSLVFIVTFFVEAAAFKGMTDASSQTEEHKHCTERLEENPEDVDIICNRTEIRPVAHQHQRRALIYALIHLVVL